MKEREIKKIEELQELLLNKTIVDVKLSSTVKTEASMDPMTITFDDGSSVVVSALSLSCPAYLGFIFCSES